MADFFLRRFAAETKKDFSHIAGDAIDKLLGYGWPGNVRELANVIERAVVLGDGPVLIQRHLPARVAGNAAEAAPEPVSYHDAVAAYCRNRVVNALIAAHGNRVVAAKNLGLHQTHLIKLIKALDIQ